jgi:hypothetical protein
VNYTVIWLESAESELADVWLNASNREHVSAAAYEIDIRLRTNPEIEGESRSEERRILLVPPLGVTFEVQPGDRLVRVLEGCSRGPADIRGRSRCCSLRSATSTEVPRLWTTRCSQGSTGRPPD